MEQRWQRSNLFRIQVQRSGIYWLALTVLRAEAAEMQRAWVHGVGLQEEVHIMAMHVVGLVDVGPNIAEAPNMAPALRM